MLHLLFPGTNWRKEGGLGSRGDADVPGLSGLLGGPRDSPQKEALGQATCRWGVRIPAGRQVTRRCAGRNEVQAGSQQQ